MPADVIHADQAIFTSHRCPTGQGYRIVAASPGVSVAEKAEITRWCPSHASLAGDSAEAAALLTFRLGTGRRCVGWSRHAGKEHTARGGFRVYTRLLVLTAEDYCRLACDPFQVARAAALSSAPADVPKTAFLPPAELSGPGAQRCPPSDPPVRLPVLGRIAWAVLSGHRAAVVDAPDPLAVLEWALRLIPDQVRETLSISAGLRFSPCRPVHLAIFPAVRRFELEQHFDCIIEA